MNYIKMNGLGNNFIVLDGRQNPLNLTEAQIVNINRPNDNLGYDQLLSIEPSQRADIFMGIWNNDGSEVAACGNGTRAVALAYMDETGLDKISIETKAGILKAVRKDTSLVEIDMGEPKLDWQSIPLSERMDTITMELQIGPIDNPILWGPGGVSMGNPHCVFIVDDINNAPVTEMGPIIEHHPLFPERANIGFAQIIDKETIRLKVWERGVGMTKACGTGACAALVASHRKMLVKNKAKLILDGGELLIEWRRSDNHVYMTGPAEYDGKGVLTL